MAQDLNKNELNVNDKVYLGCNNKIVKGTILEINNDIAVVQFQTRNEKGHFITVTEKRKVKEVLNNISFSNIKTIVKEKIIEKVIEKPVEKVIEKIVEKPIGEVKIIYKPTPRNLLPKITL